MMSKVQAESKGLTSISFCVFILVSITSFKIAAFRLKSSKNPSRIWKWKVGVNIFRSFFHLSPNCQQYCQYIWLKSRNNIIIIIILYLLIVRVHLQSMERNPRTWYLSINVSDSLKQPIWNVYIKLLVF